MTEYARTKRVVGIISAGTAVVLCGLMYGPIGLGLAGTAYMGGMLFVDGAKE